MIYLELFWTFFKIGAFTFGGGYAMIPLIQDEMIKKGWMELEELINFIAVSESTPGPFAINIATYVGTETAGILGAVCASFGIVLPSFMIILIVARCFIAFKENRVVKGCMRGLRPAVVGLIGAATITIGRTAFIGQKAIAEAIMSWQFFYKFFIFGVMLVLINKKKHPIMIISLSALLGIVGGLIGIF